jgi:hypothetical protein
MPRRKPNRHAKEPWKTGPSGRYSVLSLNRSTMYLQARTVIAIMVRLGF